MAGGERILELLNTPVEVQDAENASEMPPIVGAVRFENVSFHYSDDPTLVLDQINLDVKLARRLPSSVRRARARRPSSNCSRASMTQRTAACSWTALTCGR
jgi:ABC-type multidrug transport system fused ATPase/permease subunit